MKTNNSVVANALNAVRNGSVKLYAKLGGTATVYEGDKVEYDGRVYTAKALGSPSMDSATLVDDAGNKLVVKMKDYKLKALNEDTSVVTEKAVNASDAATRKFKPNDLVEWNDYKGRHNAAYYFRDNGPDRVTVSIYRDGQGGFLEVPRAWITNSRSRNAKFKVGDKVVVKGIPGSVWTIVRAYDIRQDAWWITDGIIDQTMDEKFLTLANAARSTNSVVANALKARNDKWIDDFHVIETKGTPDKELVDALKRKASAWKVAKRNFSDAAAASAHDKAAAEAMAVAKRLGARWVQQGAVLRVVMPNSTALKARNENQYHTYLVPVLRKGKEDYVTIQRVADEETAKKLVDAPSYRIIGVTVDESRPVKAVNANIPPELRRAYDEWQKAKAKFMKWWNPNRRLSERPPKGADEAQKAVDFARLFRQLMGRPTPNGYGDMTLEQMVASNAASDVRAYKLLDDGRAEIDMKTVGWKSRMHSKETLREMEEQAKKESVDTLKRVLATAKGTMLAKLAEKELARRGIKNACRNAATDGEFAKLKAMGKSAALKYIQDNSQALIDKYGYKDFADMAKRIQAIRLKPIKKGRFAGKYGQMTYYVDYTNDKWFASKYGKDGTNVTEIQVTGPYVVDPDGKERRHIWYEWSQGREVIKPENGDVAALVKRLLAGSDAIKAGDPEYAWNSGGAAAVVANAIARNAIGQDKRDEASVETWTSLFENNFLKFQLPKMTDKERARKNGEKIIKYVEDALGSEGGRAQLKKMGWTVQKMRDALEKGLAAKNAVRNADNPHDIDAHGKKLVKGDWVRFLRDLPDVKKGECALVKYALPGGLIFSTLAGAREVSWDASVVEKMPPIPRSLSEVEAWKKGPRA